MLTAVLLGIVGFSLLTGSMLGIVIGGCGLAVLELILPSPTRALLSRLV